MLNVVSRAPLNMLHTPHHPDREAAELLLNVSPQSRPFNAVPLLPSPGGSTNKVLQDKRTWTQVGNVQQQQPKRLRADSLDMLSTIAASFVDGKPSSSPPQINTAATSTTIPRPTAETILTRLQQHKTSHDDEASFSDVENQSHSSSSAHVVVTRSNRISRKRKYDDEEDDDDDSSFVSSEESKHGRRGGGSGSTSGGIQYKAKSHRKKEDTDVTMSDGAVIAVPYTREERHRVIKRFLAKRQRRIWTKKVRYSCRKNLAQSRIRIKGRFISSKGLTIDTPAATTTSTTTTTTSNTISMEPSLQ